jgi:hypothetical protein
MNTLLQKTFLQEPSPRGAVFRYGLLAVILALFAYDLHDPAPHFFRSLIVPFMLLFNHLAFQFRWPSSIMISLRVVAIAWLIFGCIFIFTR